MKWPLLPPWPDLFRSTLWRARLLWAACGLAAGMALAALWEQDELLALWQLRERALAAQPLPSGAQPAAWPTQASPAGPVPQDMDLVWPWLQARLQDHGLQVRSLQPQAALPAAPGQPAMEAQAQLQLQGRWRDWLDFVSQMNAHVPWWRLTGWQVVAATENGDQIRLQLLLRLGWHTPAPDRQTAGDLPQWPVQATQPTASTLFGVAAPPAQSRVDAPGVGPSGRPSPPGPGSPTGNCWASGSSRGWHTLLFAKAGDWTS